LACGDDQEYRERTLTELFGVFLVDVTLKVAQPWRRNIPTAPVVFVAIDDASLSDPELAALTG